MANKLQNSWSLIKASGEVLKSDKELIIFPIISSIAVIIITVLFAIPLFFIGEFDKSTSAFNLSRMPFVFLYYLLIYTVIIFSNSALVGASIIRLRGGNPTVSDGIKIASSRFTAILGYALISATIGIVLRWVQENLGLLGKLFAFISNMAWNIVTFLVVPVLVVEGVSPIEAIKKSSALLKKTWGEQIIGNVGIGLVFGLIILGLSIIFIPLAILTTIKGMLVTTILIVAVFVIGVLVLIITSSTLTTIYTAALYCYSAEGKVCGSFSESVLRDSFRKK